MPLYKILTYNFLQKNNIIEIIFSLTYKKWTNKLKSSLIGIKSLIIAAF